MTIRKIVQKVYSQGLKYLKNVKTMTLFQKRICCIWARVTKAGLIVKMM